MIHERSQREMTGKTSFTGIMLVGQGGRMHVCNCIKDVVEIRLNSDRLHFKVITKYINHVQNHCLINNVHLYF